MTESVKTARNGRVAAFLLAAVCWVLSAGPASAVSVSGLYAADVPVAGTSADALKAGYAEGLRQVMVRVSGTREVLELEGIDEVLADAESMLLSYQVNRTAGQSRLQMSFGAVGVNRALASVQAPVWGANRPLTLAWIAVEDRGDRQLLTRAADSAPGSNEGLWAQHLLSAAADRGLPIAFPPETYAGDRALLSDLWGQFVGRIQQASDDLSHDALALVRISRSGGQWRAGWVVEGMGLDAGEQSVNADTPEQLAQALIDRWTEQYASRYAVTAGEAGEAPKVDMVLEGVTTLADYGQVTRALQDMTPVVSVGASRVRGNRLTVEVAFSGELDQLKEHIALDARFVPAEQPAEPITASKNSQATGSEGDGAAQTGEAGSRNDTEAPAGTDAQGSAETAGFSYQPLAPGDEQDAEQAFESLYQVLYYRWQPAPGATGGDRS
ncbi:DUF2066 domain-containing protein [Marinobacter hydrocarbonoclasticus]|uniref:DUF2066 domain-containing protein n=1 Tax=Marinobacter nauticus TaxID=2743 RepID=UPI001C97ED63|nr:DUF2066 domain-containing protein [Marinobacter nauticus]MBY6194415.1 DUF2066 domain-containing protein [Marinobacter nauticus]MBY6215562.1 DUF2066 domain-containing protein [Marinobacter nauticus]